MKRFAPVMLLICSLPVLTLALDPRFVVILEGTAVGEPAMVPDVDGDGLEDEATCWSVDVVNPLTNRSIGKARDCLTFIDLDGTGVKPVGTTFFQFPYGSFISRGKNTGQPVLWDPAIYPDVNPNVTVVTGAFPAPGLNNILSGTGIFANARGNVRFSGAVRIHPDGVTVDFSCIFVIDFLPRR